MKKVLLSVVMLVFAVSVNGQKGNFSAGVNLGLPTADASDGYSFALGAEVNYLFDVSSDFKAGVSASYLTFFGKDIDFLGTTIEIENAAVLPIAGAVRYLASDKFSIGVDSKNGLTSCLSKLLDGWKEDSSIIFSNGSVSSSSKSNFSMSSSSSSSLKCHISMIIIVLRII